MKPFNLEEAKAGKPVCTKDGQDVRLICFDAIVGIKTLIVGLIKDKSGSEFVCFYNNDGSAASNQKTYDLIMKPIHRVGYINIYKDNNEIGAAPGNIYNSYSDAKNGVARKNYITTIKIEWEEK